MLIRQIDVFYSSLTMKSKDCYCTVIGELLRRVSREYLKKEMFMEGMELLIVILYEGLKPI